MCQAEAMGAVAEDMDGVCNIVSGEGSGEAIRVLWRDVRVLGGMPDEERR